MEAEDPMMNTSVLDKSCWNKTGMGISVAESMIRNGVRWLPSDSDRINGKREVHKRLRCNNEGNPGIRIFKTCTNLIRTLPTIPLSKTNSEDVDTKADDHAYDALRYMVMTRQSRQNTLSNLKFREQQTYEMVDSTFGY